MWTLGAVDTAGREPGAAEGPAPRVVLIGRPGCHLCDDARAVVAAVCARLGVAWLDAALADRPEWGDRYADLIPVVLVDGKEVACWRVDAGVLAAAIGDDGRRLSE